MGMYEDAEGDRSNRLIVETDDIFLILREIARWQKIKSPRSTIILQAKRGAADYRLVIADGEPVAEMTAGREQKDVGEFFSSMKAV